MSLSLSSLACLRETTFQCSENFQHVKRRASLYKPFVGFAYLNKNSDFMVCRHGVKQIAISSHLMPQKLEGLCIGKKQLEPASCKIKFVRTLLIDNYDSYTYNIYQELCMTNGIPPIVVRNDQWTWEDTLYYLYKCKAFDNIVISPGPGSPTCAADVGICLQLLLECKDIPILGVCLGHQALGYVHGARIIHAPEPVHGRLSEIKHSSCRIFSNVPSGRNSGFKVVRYHSLVIDAESLPSKLLPIAWTTTSDALPFLNTQHSEFIPCTCESEINQNIADHSFSKHPTNGNSWVSSHSKGKQSREVLMGIMHSTRPHYGLQFHPESIATCHGRQIFKNFREITMDYWLGIRSQRSISNLKIHNADLSCRPLGAKFLRLNWRKFDSLAIRAGGAKNIFCELFGDYKAQNTFWLDSSSTEKGRARFSFMGGRGGSLWKQLTFRLSDESGKGGGYLSIMDSQGSIKNTYLKDGFFEFLNKELQSFCYNEKEYDGLPFEFYGGFIGYMGYDLKAECGMASNRHKSRVPDACLFFVDNFVVVDHRLDDVYIMSVDDGRTSSSPWLDAIELKLIEMKVSEPEKPALGFSQPLIFNPSMAGFVADKSREQYIDDIERCLSSIREGESYELCLTTQMRRKLGSRDFLGLYLKLREENPAPYAAWLNFSNEDLCICCSSPERFLQLDKNGILEARPIKGTVARGSTEVEDEQLKFQLQYSEKDQAENLMIVDLLRNDLGRVCKPGSVHMPRLMEVESYATVHTMVSTVQGRKGSEVSAVDCIKAAFPGGSMTGAPKRRSVELLDCVEGCSRGVYSGCIGFLSCSQTFDLNIVIRTIVVHGREASIGAGGAIVALSNPEAEYEEMVLKTRAPALAVLEHEARISSKPMDGSQR